MAFNQLVEDHFHDPTTKIGKEVICLERVLNETLDGRFSGKRVNLIDLGAGNGQKAVLVLEALLRDDAQAVDYFPIDRNRYLSKYAIFKVISSRRVQPTRRDIAALLCRPNEPELVEQVATENVSLDELVAMSCDTSDHLAPIELGGVTAPNQGLDVDFVRDAAATYRAVRELGWYREGITIHCLLGRTIGNYAAQARRRFLSDLQQEMSPGDLLLLDAGLRPEPDSDSEAVPRWIRQMEKDYLVGEHFMRFEADTEGSAFQVDYDRTSKKVRYGFKRPDGSIQKMGSSYLFHASELLDTLRESGLRILCSQTSAEHPPAMSTTSPGSGCMTIVAEKPHEGSP
ncbi:MAG: L-histidine N(alpha)-methyltransferase [Thermoanaerobaculia bacterium]|nr:L-histidine N(alpha)-methyltransferase [Thermoanaerobaculia bacterium]